MVEKKNNKKVVNVNEPIQISESVNRVLTPAPEDLNGNTAVRVFKKIQRLGGNFRPNSPLRDHNLDKALTEFERAMSVDNLLYKFKHFFNSLEFSTDISGVKGVTGRRPQSYPVYHVNKSKTGEIFIIAPNILTRLGRKMLQIFMLSNKN